MNCWERNLSESLERAEIGLEEGRRSLSEAASLLQGSEQIREGNEALRALIFELVSGRDTSDDAALRASIEHLGRAVSRLHAEQMYAYEDGNGPGKPVLTARKEAKAVGGLPNAERTGFSPVTGHRFRSAEGAS